MLYRVLLKALTAFCQVLRSSGRLVCFSVMTVLKYLLKSCSPAILCFVLLFGIKELGRVHFLEVLLF